MLRAIKEGYTIKIKLPEEDGYGGYFVKCTYKYHKAKGKYLLSMWLKRDDIDDDFKIDSQEIDTQYISGNKENIEDNICRVIGQAVSSGYFDYYISRFNYTYDCFERGNELFQQGNPKEKLNTVQREEKICFIYRCQNCGQAITEGANYCQNCGTSLSWYNISSVKEGLS